MSDHYILDGHNVVAVDWLTWAKWLEGARAQRIVAQHLIDNQQPWLWRDLKRKQDHQRTMERFAAQRGHAPRQRATITDMRAHVSRILISTVFLGLDHGYGGKLLLFETLVFNGPLNDEMDRYTTWDEAEAGHAAMLARVKVALATAAAGDSIESNKTGEGGK